MRQNKWTYRILGALAFIGVVVYLDARKLGRFVFYNFSNITDFDIFPSRPLHKPAIAAPFPKAPEFKNEKLQAIIPDLDSFLDKAHTVAFLIIKNDTIQYENYFNNYTDSSIVASFSMAKSIVSLLIGIAISEKLIRDENDLVMEYLPELKGKDWDKVTIKHLLQMTSTLDFNESYFNPFGEAASFYYGTRLTDETLHLKLKATPGAYFEYTSGNTQLLGMILSRVLNGRTLTSYFEEKLWMPLGMEFDASWSIDKKNNGLEKTFCCVNARARDFAKIGRLLLHNGAWNGSQLVPVEWVEKIAGYDLSDGGSPTYQYQFWKGSLGADYMAQGHLGQYIYVHPDKQLLIVRLGLDKGGVEWKDIFTAIASTY